MTNKSEWARVGRQINVSIPVASSVAEKCTVRGAIVMGDYTHWAASGDFIAEDCFIRPANPDEWTDELKAAWKEWRARRDRPDDHDEEPWRITETYLPSPPDREAR